jgi:uncharacterized membrane protein
MAVLAQYLTVYLLGILELWIAVPAGMALKMPVIATALVSAAGALTSGVIVLAVGAPLRNWLLRMKTKKTGKLDNSVQKIWNEFGIVGLGLIAPFFTGVHLGTAIALALGSPWRKALLWMSIGTLAWSFIIAYAAAAGFSLFR